MGGVLGHKYSGAHGLWDLIPSCLGTQRLREKGSKEPKYGVCRVSVLGIVLWLWVDDFFWVTLDPRLSTR